MNEKILLIDDEPDLLRSTASLLKEEGYGVTAVSTGKEGLKMARSHLPNLLLLDLKLPDHNGLEMCKELKRDPKTQHIPIIMLTSKSDEIDIVIGFEVGADDYITKPFRKRELLARVQNALRRRGSAVKPVVIDCGPLQVNTSSFTATIKGQPVPLTPKELQLLVCLMRRENQVVTRGTISEEVWGIDISSSSRTIDVHVDQLRKKLSPFGVEILSLKGVGYRFLIEE